MKLLVLFALFFVYTQEVTSDPISFLKIFDTAIPECAIEHKLELKTVQEALSHNDLPEDDPKFMEFFVCFHIKAGLIKPDGKADKEKLLKEIPQLIMWKFGEIDSKRFAKDAGEHCKNTLESQNSDAIIAMRLRGCVLNYVTDHKK